MGTSQKLKVLRDDGRHGHPDHDACLRRRRPAHREPEHAAHQTRWDVISTGSNDITFLACCTNPAHVLNEGTLQVTTGQLRIKAVQFDQHGELNRGGGGR